MKRRRIARFAALTLLGLGLWTQAAPVSAQEEHRAGTQAGGMDTHLFRPAVDSKGFVTVNGSDILGDGDVSFGLVLDYGHNILRTARPGTAVGDNGNDCELGQCPDDDDELQDQLPDNNQMGVESLVEHSFQGTFMFNYGIANMASIGISVPVVLMAGDPAYDIEPAIGANYNTVALNQQSIHTVALNGKLRLTRVEKGIGVGVVVQAGLPVSDANQNLGGDPGTWFWPQLVVENRFGDTKWLRVGLNAGFRAQTGEVAGFGASTLEEGAVEHGNLATFGGAIALRAADSLDIIGETYGTFLMGDAADGQKLSDEVIGAFKLFVERNSYLVLGGGVRATTGYQAADLRLFLGFIFEPSIGDRDGDGYRDDEDECPDDPEDFDNFEDEDGCPDADNDKDKICDPWVVATGQEAKYADQCKGKDECPDQPEDYDGDRDDDGCPDRKAEFDGCSVKINEKVFFKFNKWDIDPRSFELLDDVASVINEVPEELHFRVEGHTDSKGSDKYNKNLSQKRADAVRNYLVGKGVKANRLQAVGFGEERPIDSNRTADGRARNRRVEFNVSNADCKKTP